MKLRLPPTSKLNNTTVIVRTDYNVPLKKDSHRWQVVDDKRLENSLQTLEFLISHRAKVVIISHLGRPNGNPQSKYSLQPVAHHLKTGFSLPVSFINDCVGGKVRERIKTMKPGEILVLENLRFYLGEQKNDNVFSKKLAALGELYINEAFSNSHRQHASMVALPKLLPAYAGFALKKEVDQLNHLMFQPKRPFVMVIGGAKISDKVAAIEHLSKIADVVLVGGGVANNFLKAEGIEIHKSYLQDIPADLKKKGVDFIKLADQLMEDHKTEKVLMDGYIPLPKIIYPIDVVAARSPQAEKTQLIDLTHDSQDTPHDKNLMYLDIGPKTIKLYQELILKAGTVFWNGPMGVFEQPQFATGTKEIARAIAKSGATTMLGGGDTIAAVDRFGLSDRYDYLSAAGGAALEFLAGKKLPGLAALSR